VLGSHEKLEHCEFREADVVSVPSKAIRFGAGLAALGNRYEEYKGLFGESVVINGNFFSYPAVKHPAVDYVLASEQHTGLEYRFLHGFLLCVR
jgi:hypothetical protein